MLKHTQSQKHVFLIPDKGERTAVGNSLYISYQMTLATSNSFN